MQNLELISTVTLLVVSTWKILVLPNSFWKKIEEMDLI